MHAIPLASDFSPRASDKGYQYVVLPFESLVSVHKVWNRRDDGMMALAKHFDEQCLELHDNLPDTPHHTFEEIMQTKTNGREETIFKLFVDQTMEYMMDRVTEIDIQEGTHPPTRTSARRIDTEDEVREKTAKNLLRYSISKARNWMAEMKKWKTGCKAHNRLYHNAYIGPVRVCVPVRSTPGVLKTEVKMHWRQLKKLLEKQNAKQKTDIAKLQVELAARPVKEGSIPNWVPQLQRDHDELKVLLEREKTDCAGAKAEASRLQKQVHRLKEDLATEKDRARQDVQRERDACAKVEVAKAMLEGQLMGLKGRFDNDSPARKRQRTGSSGPFGGSEEPSETQPRSETPHAAYVRID